MRAVATLASWPHARAREVLSLSRTSTPSADIVSEPNAIVADFISRQAPFGSAQTSVFVPVVIKRAGYTHTHKPTEVGCCCRRRACRGRDEQVTPPPRSMLASDIRYHHPCTCLLCAVPPLTTRCALGPCWTAASSCLTMRTGSSAVHSGWWHVMTKMMMPDAARRRAALIELLQRVHLGSEAASVLVEVHGCLAGRWSVAWLPSTARQPRCCGQTARHVG
jgi:hypothetical protein